MKERDILKQCIQYLNFKGYIVVRNNTGFIPITSPNGKKRAIRIGTPGSPDIIACSPDGRFVAIECKSYNGRLTAIQRAFLEELKKNNAIVIIARSVEDLINNGI